MGDFGLVGLEQVLQLGAKPKSHGSGPGPGPGLNRLEDESNRVSKLAKKDDGFGFGLRSNEQILSFSSNKPQVSFLCGKDVGLISDKNSQNLALSYFHHSTYSRAPHGNMNGSLTGIRGPFTPAQWIELEHQAMIFKYLTANVPVPPKLLLPIRKALNCSGFPGFSIGSYPSLSYGWGSFHLGFSNSTDPEPGRCRRTDGKKWRCSRDAVPDQKYCERHINRGRHRSRKPVEGLTGQAASGTTSAKVVPTMSTSMQSLVTSCGSASNSITLAQHQIKGLQPAGATDTSTNPIVNRLHDQQDCYVMPESINLKMKDSLFPAPKQLSMLDESSQSEFGLVSSDSLLNPSKSSYLGCKSYNSSFLEFSSQQNHDNHALRHLTDDWSKDQSNRPSIPWHEELKSDWTQLSMSIPMSCGLSSSASPNQVKVAISPLSLNCELDPSQMGLGIGTIVSETEAKRNAWIPIGCGNSVGGPLGEVLSNASDAAGASKSTSRPLLNLKVETWDGGPKLGASPTGVLQKSTFVSLSNSSSGGSPREGNKTQ